MPPTVNRIAYIFYRDIKKSDGSEDMQTVQISITAEEQNEPDAKALHFVRQVLNKCGGDNPKLFRCNDGKRIQMDI